MATSPADVLDSLRRADERALRQLRKLLARAVALKTPAGEVARSVRAFFSPFASPRRDPSGILRRAGRSVGRWPAAPGMASSHDRYLIDELATVAHREAVLRVATESEEPMGVKWSLSILHPAADACDSYAERDSGYGRGVFLPSEVPNRIHARCLCVLTPVSLRRIA